MGWDGMRWDGVGWDGMGWDGMGWEGMGWDGLVCQQVDHKFFHIPLLMDWVKEPEEATSKVDLPAGRCGEAIVDLDVERDHKTEDPQVRLLTVGIQPVENEAEDQHHDVRVQLPLGFAVQH